MAEITDDMEGIFSSVNEAYQAGKKAGRDEYWRALNTHLASISVKYEQGAVSGPEEPLATRGFHVSQECLKAARELKERFDARAQPEKR
jgi:hypothetical protein